MGPDPSRSGSAKLLLMRPDLDPQALIKFNYYDLLFYNATVKAMKHQYGLKQQRQYTSVDIFGMF